MKGPLQSATEVPAWTPYPEKVALLWLGYLSSHSIFPHRNVLTNLQDVGYTLEQH